MTSRETERALAEVRADATQAEADAASQLADLDAMLERIVPPPAWLAGA